MQRYSLSEIGAFLKVIFKQQGANKAEKLNTLWLAHNLPHKQLKEITDELKKQGLSKKGKEQYEQQEVTDNWKKAAAFMGGFK